MNHARFGVLSLLLEVSADPKPGNVDKEHEFKDLKYKHFLISAISAYPTFKDCMNRRGSIGLNIFKAVSRSYEICKTNVHFGAFILLIPLIWCKGNVKDVPFELKRTTSKESLHVLSAFRVCKPKVMNSDFDLRDAKIERIIIEEDLNLYRWFKRSPRENVIAREPIEGYWRCLKGLKVLKNFYEKYGDLNDSIVYTYLHLLSSYLDPLVISKHGMDVAMDVKNRARDVLREFRCGDLDAVKEFDVDLLSKGINPGSIADLTCATIYLSLKEGII